MAIGILEVGLLVSAVVPAVAVAVWKRNWRWLGLPGFFVVAALFSPADPASTLLIAVPSCCLYGLALYRPGSAGAATH